MSRSQLLTSRLVAGLNAVQSSQNFKQIDAAYYKLPVVPKDLIRGPRGKYYYINGRGKRVYLKADQQAQLQNRELKGCIGNYCL